MERPSTAVAARQEAFDALSAEPFDLLVIGGGINGAGIARDAAMRGLRTALVEGADFASGTSSRSSKLIHGGLRYLEQGNVRLVLEAVRERERLRRLAPHLVRPQEFVFPVYRDGPLARWKLAAGLWAYDLLAGFWGVRRHRMLGVRAVRAAEPTLREDGLRGAGVYFDYRTDDARLVLETALAAAREGATIVSYAQVVGLLKDGGRITGARIADRLGGHGQAIVRARVVVNATGPWVDHVASLDESGPSRLRLTKGVHVVVPRARVGNRAAIVLHAVADRRVMFVIRPRSSPRTSPICSTRRITTFPEQPSRRRTWSAPGQASARSSRRLPGAGRARPTCRGRRRSSSRRQASYRSRAASSRPIGWSPRRSSTAWWRSSATPGTRATSGAAGPVRSRSRAAAAPRRCSRRRRSPATGTGSPRR
jgi:glycine/D-amino acid oxidase-like deaminating enzyme